MCGAVPHACNEQSVFVEVVKLVESPEIIVPTFIGLQDKDVFFSHWADFTYFSLQCLRCHLLGTLKHRKPDPPESFLSDSRAVSYDELHNQVVERGPQVLNRIPSNKGDDLRDRLKTRNIMSSLRDLRVMLSRDFIRVGWAKERRNFDIQITDVLFGPFDFR